jgi:formate hydrogenlyase subunit 3/multisubunit Na+/H+ antiporter MnhD subunit
VDGANAWLVPLTGLELRMDPIAGFFLLLVGAAAFPASLYALDHHRGERRGDGAYLVFLLAMGVVPLAANAPTFLLAWELMALASYALVLHDHREPEVVRAAWVYAVMTHAGLASLLAGMLFMSASTGSLRFATGMRPVRAWTEPREAWRGSCSPSASRARRGWFPCTSGFPSRIPPRRAMSPRSCPG